MEDTKRKPVTNGDGLVGGVGRWRGVGGIEGIEVAAESWNVSLQSDTPVRASTVQGQDGRGGGWGGGVRVVSPG